MHEMSIVAHLFEIIGEIAQENKLKTISKVTVQIGAMRAVIPETFQFAFDSSKAQSIAKNAELVLVPVPIKQKCNECLRESVVEDHVYHCGACNSTDIEVIDGKDIIISSLEGDRNDH